MVIRAFCLLLLWCSSAHAELVIEVTQGKQSAIPIAVVPFAWEGSTPLREDVSAIITSDLQHSGYFRTLPAVGMISQPSKLEQVNYADWRALQQDYVVLGRIWPNGAEYMAEFHVVDVHQRIELLRHRVRGQPGQLRDMAHYISDFIFERLTGVPGVFSTKLVYVTTNRERTRFNLNYADADGAREQVIFSSEHPIISPAWSPDGQKVAYVSFENGRSEIFFQHLATGQREKIASFKGSNSAPAFSPDGKTLAFVRSQLGNPDIYTLDLASRQLTRLTRHYSIDTEPQWMPNGRDIVFTSSRAGGPQIYKIDTVDKNVQRVTFEGNYNARARVTDDGRKMVYVHQANDRFHIAAQDLESGLVHILTSETELDESPSVAPNGSMVVYAASEADRSILAAVSVDGEVKFRLPSKFGDVREPAWSPIFK
ncbi:Tol-Pal system beta propeller repeat protein TolB [Bacterioplanes sanyensis]|uniref:Tol-Pal system protein TolB n=1 Tax=Bacterioplanes sanyensis TaxID=1249553 RepID=A0A222FM51_9GAMM|nr:Tol-Pal system beta propeller repeat protein TolB [Bacterioplanes sanyensis]ASP39461.1 Tol-Pal system beta propeller repeat protein TolB [Bacterioplanes sanyensis]